MTIGFRPADRYVIGLGHVARVGKDVAAARLVEEHGFTRLSTADLIREFCRELNPIVNAAVSAPPEYIEMIRYNETIAWHGEDSAKDKEAEVRRLQQEVGQIMRRLYGQDFWSLQMERLIRDTPGSVVVSDVRFPNECETLWGYGGAVVRIDRPGFAPLDHITDQALADFDGWNYIIRNDGDIDVLHERVDEMVADLKDGGPRDCPIYLGDIEQ